MKILRVVSIYVHELNLRDLTRCIVWRSIQGRVRRGVMIGERICHVRWWRGADAGRTLRQPSRVLVRAGSLVEHSTSGNDITVNSSCTVQTSALIACMACDFPVSLLFCGILMVQNIHSSPLPAASLSLRAQLHRPHHALVYSVTA